MLARYTSKQLGKQQLQLELRMIAGRDALRQALLAMVPQIDELQRKREQMKQQQPAAPAPRPSSGLEGMPPLQAQPAGGAAPEGSAVKQESGTAPEGSAVKQEGGAVKQEGGPSSSAFDASRVPSQSALPRKSTLPVQALVHAFHCADLNCTQKTCSDTKQARPPRPSRPAPAPHPRPAPHPPCRRPTRS